MNNNIQKIIKNFSYTLSSNLTTLAISGLVTFVIPKLMGIEEYGYWQLYLFYSSYVGFLHFGWNDGIYLYNGGKEYKDIDKNLYFSQFHMLIAFQVILAIIILFITNMINFDANRVFIIKMTTVCMILTNSKLMLVYILQATNRIQEYAQITIIEKVIYGFMIILFLSFGFHEFKIIILADLIGRSISLLWAIYYCKDIVFRKISVFYFAFNEAIDNINVGIKLMFSNIASMLIIGVIRLGIEKSWDVSVFGKVSLTLSISNLLMIFINAIGIIMFPILRRVKQEQLTNIYITMRDFLMIIMLGILIIYYPIRIVLSGWLPEYSDSLRYMALLFPMSIYEGKMALLINTYLKTLRKEKSMLKFNLVALLLSILITFFTTLIAKNLTAAVLSIVLILAFRSIIAEIYLSAILKVKVYKDIILELVMTFIFILVGWFLPSFIAFLIYIIAYCTYIFIKKKDIKQTINSMKILLK